VFSGSDGRTSGPTGIVRIVSTETVSDTVYRRLGEAIRRGIYAPGTRLPGERDLAEQLGVSRVTLRVALERLETEQALSRSAQRGWFVPRPTVGEPPSTLQSFTEMARLRGLHATATVLEQSVRSATFEEATRLAIAPGAGVLTIVRLRGMDGTPVCVDSNVLPLALAAPLVDADLTDQSLYENLEVRCGVSIDRSAYTVQAEAATAEMAPLLQIPQGSPVLIGREVAYTFEGHPVLLGLNTYRGDAYRFEADLYRTRV
jgi:GntR family transcriptional regulator